MEYIELPECKSADEFEVGETVKLYSYYLTPVILQISGRSGDVLFFKPNGEFNIETHFKCVRKIKKKEPRVFWIHKNSIPLEEDNLPVVCFEKPNTDTYGEYIKVQEID